MSVNNLSTEVMDMVCGYLTIEDLKNVRLVSRTFQKSADQYMYPEMVMSFNRPNIQATLKIVHNFRDWDEYRRQPMDFIWYVDAKQARLAYIDIIGMVPGAAEREDGRRFLQQAMSLWEDERAFRPTMRPAWRLEFPQEVLQRCFQYHQELFNDEDAMITTSFLENSLRSIFQHCRNIKTIELDMDSSLRSFLTGTIVDSRAFVRALSNYKHNTIVGFDRVVVMSTVISVAAELEIRPTILRMNSTPELLTTEQENLTTLFQSLQDLHWQFKSVPGPETLIQDSSVDFDDLEETMRENSLMQMLRGSQNLRKLYMAFFCRNDMTEPHIMQDLKHVVSDIHWSHLTSFSITAVRTSVNTLESFLLRHADTLQNLDLADLFLRNGIWPDFWTRISTKLPHLQRVRLRGTLTDTGPPGSIPGNFVPQEASGMVWLANENEDDDYDQHITDFLINGGPQCPSPERSEDGSGAHWTPGPAGSITSSE